SLSTQETEYSVSCVEKISPLSIQIHFRETLPHLHYTKFLTVPFYLCLHSCFLKSQFQFLLILLIGYFGLPKFLVTRYFLFLFRFLL
ncbi:hypothetical protein ETC01_16965, partial [Geobacillus sp. NFOSA3]|nr:hypothetical protein [Geobacillus sp. NFOSA3]